MDRSEGELPPIFVVGMPRSGTTLLARMLEAGGDYVALPESHFFSRFVWTSLGRRSPTSLGRAWDRFHELSTSEPGNPPSTGRRSTRPAMYQAVFTSWAEAIAQGASTYGWIENTPAHLEGLPFIRSAFPSARVIGIVRDPRDVHASLSRVAWNRKSPAANAARWRWYAEALIRRVEAESERCFLVRYEDLVLTPRETLQRICRWLGVPFTTAMLAHEQVSTRAFDVSSEPWKRQALGSTTPARIGRWRDRLTTGDAAAIEAVAGTTMDRFSYERENIVHRLPPSERMAVLQMRARLRAYSWMTWARAGLWNRNRGTA